MNEVIVLKPSELLKARGIDPYLLLLRKGRALPDGTIREWRGKKYKKVSGKWQPYREKGGEKQKKRGEKKSAIVWDDIPFADQKKMAKLERKLESGEYDKESQKRMKADLKKLESKYSITESELQKMTGGKKKGEKGGKEGKAAAKKKRN